MIGYLNIVKFLAYVTKEQHDSRHAQNSLHTQQKKNLKRRLYSEWCRKDTGVLTFENFYQLCKEFTQVTGEEIREEQIREMLREADQVNPKP